MENILVGFGKHAHLSYKELAVQQPGYVQWLFREDWFAGKHPKLYEYLDSVGMRPKDQAKVTNKFQKDNVKVTNKFQEDNLRPSDNAKSDDTKLTHNQYQAMFLDFDNIKKLLYNVFDDVYDYVVDDIIFEDISDVDIILKLTRKRRYNPQFTSPVKTLLGWWYGDDLHNIHLLIELKTSLTSDYPEVLRQLRRQRRSYITHHTPKNVTIKQVLVTQGYSGDVSLSDVRGVYRDIDVIVF